MTQAVRGKGRRLERFHFARLKGGKERPTSYFHMLLVRCASAPLEGVQTSRRPPHLFSLALSLFLLTCPLCSINSSKTCLLPKLSSLLVSSHLLSLRSLRRLTPRSLPQAPPPASAVTSSRTSSPTATSPSLPSASPRQSTTSRLSSARTVSSSFLST